MRRTQRVSRGCHVHVHVHEAGTSRMRSALCAVSFIADSFFRYRAAQLAYQVVGVGPGEFP
jgi:hypothetical protein